MYMYATESIDRLMAAASALMVADCGSTESATYWTRFCETERKFLAQFGSVDAGG
jgi:hypothetical protein